MVQGLALVVVLGLFELEVQVVFLGVERELVLELVWRESFEVEGLVMELMMNRVYVVLGVVVEVLEWA